MESRFYLEEDFSRRNQRRTKLSQNEAVSGWEPPKPDHKGERRMSERRRPYPYLDKEERETKIVLWIALIWSAFGLALIVYSLLAR